MDYLETLLSLNQKLDLAGLNVITLQQFRLIQKELVNDDAYEALYCCDTCESSYATVSVHRTLKGAEKAVAFGKHEQLAKDDDAEEYTDWAVRPLKILE